MKINEIYYGFRVTDVTRIDAIDATMHLLTHERSGARLCYLERKDRSRTFAITFGTPPTDDTGVFHILEHSVLCGSRKFPTKEPFTELLKGSLNTFLNAMTYSDKTAYPVASGNDKDFYNLVDVYMDAVLHPRAVECENVFRQEGWRYESDGKELSYNGVVYSEMKGVYSSADSIAAYHNSRLLFPGGTYSYDSGGNPDHIPDLSYESFVEAHKAHYHPSGAYMFLDGEPKLDEILPLLDSYLSEYEKSEVEYRIERGGEVITEPMRVSCEAAEGEDEESGIRLYLSYVAGECYDQKAVGALAMITDAVADSNEAPLKKAILSAGLCDNAYFYFLPGTRWSTLNVEFRGVRAGSEDALIAHYDKCISELLEGGIDRELVRASKDRMEFKAREADYGSTPKGVVYMSAINDIWLYGMHPAQALDHDAASRLMTEALDGSYLEDTLRGVITSPRATLILTPSKSAEAQRAARVEARLKDALGEDKEAALKKYQASTDAFKAWQAAPDTPEALATIPRLTLDDLGDEPTETPTIIDKYKGSELILHPISTGGISYLEMYFDASDADEEEISLLSLMGMLYPNLDTRLGSANDFRRRSKSKLGAISILPTAMKNGKDAKLYLVVKLSALDSNLEAARDLAREYIFDIVLDNIAALRRSLVQYTDLYSDLIKENGHSIAITRAAARYSGVHAIKEYSAGYSFYRWLKSHKDDTDEELGHLIEKMKAAAGRIFTGERLSLSYTGKAGTERLTPFVDFCPSGKPTEASRVAPLPRKNEGIAIPSMVSYAVLCGDLFDTGATSHNGAWSTMATIMDFELLWEKVRVEGGAYGTGFISRANSGQTAFYSYRDPSPKRSIEVYKNAPELLRERLSEGDLDLTGYIIGTVGASEPVTTPASDGSAATVLYLSGKSHADTLKHRRECIATTKEGLIELSHLLDEVLKGATAAVVGPREQLVDMGLDEILEI